MIGCRGTILGGLPVYAYVNGGYDSFPGEYWSEVTEIHWLNKDGSPGKVIPDHLHDKAHDYDYGFGSLIEAVGDDYHSRNSED